MSLVIPKKQEFLKTAFGELSVAEATPIVQVSAQYGLVDEMMSINTLTGTTKASNSLFSSSTGTNPLGLASINTRKQLAYKAGQGALCRITALFSAGAANSLQVAGLINSEDGYAFGYLNEDFGIIFSRHGEVEYQELTISVAASGNESPTTTINGNNFITPVTAGSTNQNAAEIALSLSAEPTLGNFLITANENIVSVMNLLPGPNSSYSFTPSGTCTGTFIQVTTGVNPVISIIKQADWNQEDLLKGDFILNPQFGNVYSIDISYLGFGNIFFYIEHPKTGRPLLVHILEYANANTVPSVGNPTFRIGWLARNLGNTTNLTVSGGSCAGFIEGKLVRDSLPRGRSQNATSVGLTQTNLITIRNRFHFGSKINRANVIPLLLSFGTDSSKGALFTLTANAVFTSAANFRYEDKDNSIVEYMDDPVAFSGGRVLATFYVSSSGSVVNSDQFKSLILPDDQLTLSAAVVANPVSLMIGTAVWQEDI